MNRIIRIIPLVFAFALFSGCEDDITSIDMPELSENLVTPFREFALEPVADGVVALSSTVRDSTIEFSWESANSGLNRPIDYTVVIYDTDAGVDNAVFEITANDEGSATAASITHQAVNNVLEELGMGIGEDTTMVWTVRAVSRDRQTLSEPQSITFRTFVDEIAPFSLITPPSPTIVILSRETPDAEIMVEWGSTFSGFENDITYQWVATVAGNDDPDARLELDADEMGEATQITFTHQTLNDQLMALGLAEGETVILEWHAVASVDGSLTRSSNEVFQVVFRTFPAPDLVIPTLFLVGDATAAGWDNNNNNTPLFRDPENGAMFYYQGFFSAGGFKLLENLGQWQPQWGLGASEGLLGVNDGTGSDPEPIPVPADGYYEFVFDGIAGTYTFESMDVSSAPTFATVGIIGSATPNEWNDPDTDMTQSTFDDHKWFISAQDLTANALKFRADDNWDVNWGGDTFPYGLGPINGPDISIPLDANYLIWFNDLDGRYAIIEQ